VQENTPPPTPSRKYLQQQIDRVYADFVNDISRGRGISVETVKKDFGQGLVVDAREALRKRMIDQIVATPTEAFAFASTYASKHDAIGGTPIATTRNMAFESPNDCDELFRMPFE
jgi:ClpP class serine protease